MSLRTILMSASLVVSALEAQEQEEELSEIKVSGSFAEASERYGAESVTAVEIISPSLRKETILIGYGPSGLTLQTQDFDSPITLPEDGMRNVIDFVPNIDSALYGKLRELGRREEALELVRAETYPLLKFVPVDPAKLQIHREVDQLIGLLIDEDKIDEAASIVESFSRQRISNTFSERAVEVGRVLVEKGDTDRAYKLVKRLPLGPGETTYVDLYLQLANRLRESEDWDNSRALYKDVQLASSPSETPEAFLWEAYIHLQEDRAFMVADLVNQIGEVEPDSEYFSLAELIRGVSLALEGDDQRALSAFSKGIVYSTTNDPWAPELLYRAAEKYEDLGLDLPAMEIKNELRFFFPDSVWVERI